VGTASAEGSDGLTGISDLATDLGSTSDAVGATPVGATVDLASASTGYSDDVVGADASHGLVRLNATSARALAAGSLKKLLAAGGDEPVPTFNQALCPA